MRLGLPEGMHRLRVHVVRVALRPQDAGQELSGHIAREKSLVTPVPSAPPVATRRRPCLRGEPVTLEPRLVRARRPRLTTSRVRPRVGNDGGRERARRVRKRRT